MGSVSKSYMYEETSKYLVVDEEAVCHTVYNRVPVGISL
jgi:hypothetical protein